MAVGGMRIGASNRLRERPLQELRVQTADPAGLKTRLALALHCAILELQQKTTGHGSGTSRHLPVTRRHQHERGAYERSRVIKKYPTAASTTRGKPVHHAGVIW